MQSRCTYSSNALGSNWDANSTSFDILFSSGFNLFKVIASCKPHLCSKANGSYPCKRIAMCKDATRNGLLKHAYILSTMERDLRNFSYVSQLAGVSNWVLLSFCHCCFKPKFSRGGRLVVKHKDLHRRNTIVQKNKHTKSGARSGCLGSNKEEHEVGRANATCIKC